MDKTQVTQTLKKIKENSQKRNFTQSYDLIINLRDIDLKKPEQSVDNKVEEKQVKVSWPKRFLFWLANLF